MISCVICSRRPDISAELKENIASTIGCEYELIVIDNSKNEYSIFSAYNEGVRRANGDVLCFMHEDIMYHTQGWGKIVDSYFINDTNMGLIGNVGTHLMPKTISGWYHPMLYSGGCIQNTNGIRNYQIEDKYLKKTNQNIIEVVAVDGMWFCIPGKLFTKIKFDQNTFSHFHCYDLDICMQIKESGYKICVTNEIILEHNSYGNFDMQWYEDSRKFYEKWKNILPLTSGLDITNEEINIRTDIVNQVMVWQNAYAQCNDELLKMRKSYAYRIGKFIVSFLKVFRRNV